MNNIMIYGTNELEKINFTRISKIKQYAIYNYKKFMYKNIPDSKGYYQFVNRLSVKSPRRAFVKFQAYDIYPTLEINSKFIANGKSFNFENETEKNIFLCELIFFDNNKFLEKLDNCDMLITLNKFIIFNNFIENKFANNYEKMILQKKIFYKSFFEKYNTKIKIMLQHFYEFHRISDINLIINKLSQINYFDNDLYDSYIQQKNKEKIKI